MIMIIIVIIIVIVIIIIGKQLFKWHCHIKDVSGALNKF